MNKTNQMASFTNLGIAQSILNQLQKLGFNVPTPIQHQAIPIAITGQDLMGIAQTGTGKTLAFGIPMMQRLHTIKGSGLILLPTRELAIQVDQSLKGLGRAFGLRTAVLIGGTPMGPQIKALDSRPHIIIATPGRLNDHLQRRKVILNNIKIVVLDEADRMLDMGFEPQIRKILALIPQGQRQTMLFSATMPEKITRLAKNYMRSPLRVEVAPAGTASKTIEQEIFIVPKQQKLSLLNELLKQYKQRVLIFSRTKHGARKMCRALAQMGYKAAEIHSNKSLSQRSKALKDFKSGFCRILVATDIASRGIDVQDIELVINFDLPDNPEDYVHRIGRTGRAGKTGRAISFVAPEQKRDIFSIERLIKSRLPIRPLPTLSESLPVESTIQDRPKPFGHGRRGNERERSRKSRGPKSRRRRPFERGRRGGSRTRPGRQNYF